MDEAGAIFDPEAFQRAVGRFAAGVTVVTTRSSLGLRGITVSGFTFVSRNPPLVLVCIVGESSFTPTIDGDGGVRCQCLAGGR